MKQLYLKIQLEAVKLENVINFKRSERNRLIDERKAKKKEKDVEAVALINKELTMTEQDIINLEAKMKELDRDFETLKHRLGLLRLNNYVFADVMYNNLLEYQEFLKTYVVNEDKDMVVTLQKAIDLFKQLPFEMADGNCKTNELYNAITDKFIDRWKTIRDGVIQQVIEECDKEDV